MTQLELLAPAKNAEFGIAAINCGADAVYIGAPRFGARSAAGNSIADIEKLANYSHKFRAKTYVALNTLLFDNELSEAEKIINDIWNAGADALIIQDMGILEMNLPPIPLFASTQTHNTDWQKVDFLEKVGFQRVILARELSLNEISEIRSKTNIEIESFVHGAICVSYSGQCYLSHAISGKSGNRGECQQACRWEYSLKNNSGKTLVNNQPLLSPKDMNMGNHLEELIKAGVTSFKIEGRLKDIAYLKNITSWYRQKLDFIIDSNSDKYQKVSLGNVEINFTPDPEKTFNRGYTNYFIEGRHPGIASGASQKSIGKRIGKVCQIGPKSIKIDTQEILANGDGLCFFDENNTLQGFRVNRAEGQTVFPFEMPVIKVGTELYRNQDKVFEETLEKEVCIRKIPVEFELSETPEGIQLKAICNSAEAMVETKFEKQVANQVQKAEDTIRQALSKTGNTIFGTCDIKINFSQPLFIPQSVINELRRSALQMLDNKLNTDYKRDEIQLVPNEYPYYEKELHFESNILNNKALCFYLRHGCELKEMGFELHSNFSGKKLMTTKYCIKFEMGQCPKYHNSKDKDWQSELYIENSKGKFMLSFDCKECEMNVSNY